MRYSEQPSENQIQFGSVSDLAATLHKANTFLISDEAVFQLHGSAFGDLKRILTPRGENAKNLDTLRLIYRSLLEHEVDRSWRILALGGGALLDTAGFAAATWMRGISCIYIPTTLLAMVDASLGGKTAIDFEDRKNLIGLFKQPEVIYCDLNTLSTLPWREFSSGMAEVIKHAIISGEECFSYLERLAASMSGVRRIQPSTLEEMVRGSQLIKMGIVRNDPFESGNRKVLNLGHTMGHAIETATAMPHGFAISLGIILACKLSSALGFMKSSSVARVENLLSAWELPTDLASSSDRSRVKNAAAYLAVDKKRAGSSIHFALPVDIGRVEIREIPVEVLRDFLSRSIG